MGSAILIRLALKIVVLREILLLIRHLRRIRYYLAQPNEDEAKYQKYADECEATKGLLSEASAKELVADGFARIQVDKLCEESDEELRHSGMDLRGVCHNKCASGIFKYLNLRLSLWVL